MKRKILYLLLGAFLLVLAGCTGASEEESDAAPVTLDPLIAEHLNIGDSLPEALAKGVRAVEEKIDGEDFDIFVRQTVGDAQAIYVLYDVTFREGINLTCQENEFLEPALIQLAEKGGSALPLNMWGTEVLASEGQTVTFLSYFCGWTPWPGKDKVDFTTGNFQKNNGWQQTALTSETATVLLQLPGETDYLKGSLKDETGKSVGEVCLSPLALSCSVSSAEQADSETLTGTAQIACRNGQTVPVLGRICETQEGDCVNGMIKFEKALDLDTVTAVQIAGYTIEF